MSRYWKCCCGTDIRPDIWFHRYVTNDRGELVDVEGKCKLFTPRSPSEALITFTVDYNSWIESDKGLRLAASLDKETILAEGIVLAVRLSKIID